MKAFGIILAIGCLVVAIMLLTGGQGIVINQPNIPRVEIVP